MTTIIETLVGFGAGFGIFLCVVIAFTLFVWLISTETGNGFLLTVVVVVILVFGPIACINSSRDFGHSILAHKASL